jgi:hypothetical protein
MTAASSILTGGVAKTSGGTNSASLTASAAAVVPAGTPMVVYVFSSGNPISYNSTGQAAGTLIDSAGNIYTQIANIAETATASGTIALFLCSATAMTHPIVVGGTPTTLNVSTGVARPLGFQWIQVPGYGAVDVAVITNSGAAAPYLPGALGVAAGAQILAFGINAMTGITAINDTGGGTFNTHVEAAAGTSATRQSYWATCVDGVGTVTPSFTETGGTGSDNWATIALSFVPVTTPSLVRGTTKVAVGATSTSGAIPAGTLGGDLIVVFLDVNQLASAAGVTPALPAGFAAVAASQLATSLQSYAWFKVAAGTFGAASSDAGATLSFNTAASVSNRSHLEIIVLEGSGGAAVIAAAGGADTTTTATRVTPAVSGFGVQVSILDHICDKSAAPGTNWTAPGTFTKIIEEYDTGSGLLTSVTALSNSSVLTSPQGSDSYVQTATASQATKWTIAFDTLSSFYHCLIKQAGGTWLPATCTIL